MSTARIWNNLLIRLRKRFTTFEVNQWLWIVGMYPFATNTSIKRDLLESTKIEFHNNSHLVPETLYIFSEPEYPAFKRPLFFLNFTLLPSETFFSMFWMFTFPYQLVNLLTTLPTADLFSNKYTHHDILQSRAAQE